MIGWKRNCFLVSALTLAQALPVNSKKLMTIDELILLLRDCNLSKVTFSKIFSTIVNNGIQLPILTAMVKKGAIIQRGRIGKEGEIFYSELDISYIADEQKILTYGRANRPYQSIFYGSMPTPKIQYPTITLFTKLVEELRMPIKKDFEKTMTVGRWIVKEDFEVADSCYSLNYASVSENLEIFQYWKKKLTGTEIGSISNLKALSFFADMFAKAEIKNHNDYKLSAIYTEFALRRKLNGILYPSMKTDYNGKNIAITPKSVEKYLELKQVGVFKLIVKNGIEEIIQTHYTDELGPLNSNFK